MKNILLSFTEEQLNPIVVPLIKNWKNNFPTALEVLQVIDYAIDSGRVGCLGSKLLIITLKLALENDNITIQEVIAQENWRDDLDRWYIPDL